MSARRTPRPLAKMQTMDKLREIATLKLIGTPDRKIIGLIVQQALAMGAIGFGFGALLISAVKDSFPRRVVLQPEDGLVLAAIVRSPTT